MLCIFGVHENSLEFFAQKIAVAIYCVQELFMVLDKLNACRLAAIVIQSAFFLAY